MFSAVALVVFNGFAIANNIENRVPLHETVPVSGWERQLVKFVEKYAPCLSAAEGVRLKGAEHGLSQDVTDDIAAKAFADCANTIDG